MLGNWLGEVFAIGYTLGVYVKFDGMLEHGQGDKLNIPIRIFNEPRLVQSDEQWRIPEDWNPISDGYDPTYLFHEQNKVSEYFDRVWLANWRMWY